MEQESNDHDNKPETHSALCYIQTLQCKKLGQLPNNSFDRITAVMQRNLESTVVACVCLSKHQDVLGECACIVFSEVSTQYLLDRF